MPLVLAPVPPVSLIGTLLISETTLVSEALLISDGTGLAALAGAQQIITAAFTPPALPMR